MKSKLFSLAALLLAGASSSALAQDQQIQNGGPMYNAAQQAKARQAQAQAQAQAHQAPANPAQAAPGAQGQPHQHGPGQRPPQPGQPPQAQPAPPAQRPPQAQPPQQQNGRPQPGSPGGPSYRGGPGDRHGGNPQGDGRQNWNGRGPGPDQQEPGRPGPDRHDGGRYDGGRYDGGRYDGEHRDGEHRGDHGEWNRPGDGRGPDWDRDHGRAQPHNGPQWAPRRYPPIYNSPSRYRGPYWRPPADYYVRAWRFGELLPRGWYAPDYQLMDWWSYGLPEPPPGYDWVRVGRDALLVDDYGRIYQVVRSVFW